MEKYENIRGAQHIYSHLSPVILGSFNIFCLFLDGLHAKILHLSWVSLTAMPTLKTFVILTAVQLFRRKKHQLWIRKIREDNFQYFKTFPRGWNMTKGQFNVVTFTCE